jgi:pimeloyl-ACP methyl ester carboxylesterase
MVVGLNKAFFYRRLLSVLYLLLIFCGATTRSYEQAPTGTTIFVHGAIPAFLAFCAPSCLLGLNSLREYDVNYGRGVIGYTLHTSFPEEYPLDSFYIFGWPGDLTFESRYEAAEELYLKMKLLPPPYTVIGHSHGCNVALNFVKVAERHNDHNFRVQRLILLACPVQVATTAYVRSPIFEQVFSFYSSADIGQVIDPQGLHYLPYSISASYNIPLLSGRVFCPSDNLIQARVLIHRRNPWHSDFTRGRFLNHLLPILELLEKSQNLPRRNPNKPIVLNITRQGRLELYESICHELHRVPAADLLI